MNDINRDIAKCQRKLMLKARRKGLWENFGQNEVHKLLDVYGLQAEIVMFNEWCLNVDLDTVKNWKF